MRSKNAPEAGVCPKDPVPIHHLGRAPPEQQSDDQQPLQSNDGYTLQVVQAWHGSQIWYRNWPKGQRCQEGSGTSNTCSESQKSNTSHRCAQDLWRNVSVELRSHGPFWSEVDAGGLELLRRHGGAHFRYETLATGMQRRFNTHCKNLWG